MFTIRKGEGSLVSRPFRQALKRLLERYDGTPFELRFWDGNRLRLGAGAPEFSLTFRTRRALYETVARSTLGLGEAYVRREVVFDGDLEDALTGLCGLTQRVAGRLPRFALPGVAGVMDALGLGAAARAAGRESVAAVRPEDLGDDFYSCYLGRRLQIATGYFATPGETLDQAQTHKMVLTTKKLALRRGQRLLDIGCGWGHFMFHVAETYGVQCLGLTTSESQARAIRAQAAARRLPVEVRVMGYEDMEDEARWDRIVSLGSVGDAGERRMDGLYDKVKALLSPSSGVCLLESVTRTAEAPRADPFLQRYILRGSFLPSLEEMAARAAARGLDVLDVENLRRHSALTAHCWRRNFLQNQEKIRRLTGLDDSFLRMWEFYLAYTVAAFRAGHLGVVQMVMSNGAHAEVPLAREPLFAPEELAPRERAHSVPAVQVGLWGASAPS